MSGYFRAALDALVARGVEVTVLHQRNSADAPFDAFDPSAGVRMIEWSEPPTEAQIDAVLGPLVPDAIFVNSWHITPYRRTAGRWGGRSLRVLCMDNQWWSTPKQWAGIAAARWLIRPNYDAVMLPGDRQAAFANRLGFPFERMLWGLYSGESARFEKVAADREGELPPEAFLYVGRLVREKGVDVLAEGYRRYRATSTHPWPLVVAGTGPLGHLFDDVADVEQLGFVQPAVLPDVFARTGCLVLPSRFEPWGVVVHEAASAQLPVICTWVSGASTRLVVDDVNGVVITANDPDAVANALRRISEAPPDDRRRMGAASGELARQFSPEQWADTVVRRVPQLRLVCGLTATPGASPRG